MTARKLRNLVVVALLLFAATSARAEASLLELLTGFAAKETCSCIFVVGQTETYCKDFGSPSFPTTITIDKTAKTVTSSAGISTRTARFADGAAPSTRSPERRALVNSAGGTPHGSAHTSRMSASPRPVTRIVEPRPVIEGAGVRLRRSIALPTFDHLDPFLLLDHFSSDNPDDYLAGFPRHPHRGIETVTYLLAGAVRHGDSLGNRGTIEGGDVQWMTAGRGILHEEFPEPREGKMDGFQLWVNLPARAKLCPPRYQDLKASAIPTVQTPEGVSVRLVAGRVGDVEGPVSAIAARPLFLDAELPPGGRFAQAIPDGHAAFAYLFRGEASLGGGQAVSSPRLAVLGEEGPFEAVAGARGARFLLCAGQPFREPIARYGPFVMNTRAEIEQTLRELADGTFARS